jgi:hypothetical protein
MSNYGHGAEARGWLKLVYLTQLKGLFLATLALKYLVISRLLDDHTGIGLWLFKYYFLASETLIAIGILAAMFKLLFINKSTSGRRLPSHLPWWCGR